MEAQTFELKTPYLKTGRSHNILAQTDLINVAIKYYYEGGENTLHTHPTEDHVFVAGYHLYYPSRRHSSPAFALLVDALRYRR